MSIASSMTVVGIDVAGADFVASGLSGPAQHFTNDAAGIAVCLDWLADMTAPLLVGFEATGGHEYRLWQALAEAGIRARQLNPARIRAFGRGTGQLAKTDPIDARLIAAYLTVAGDAGRELPEKNLRRIRALCTKRRQIIALRKAVAAQARRTEADDLAAIEADQIALFDVQIARINRLLDEAVASDPDAARRQTLLTSIPAFGPVVSRTLICEMPELGTLSEAEAGALAGLAPMARDSGARSAKRFIQGGRKVVRDVLYQAAIVASRHNPDMKRFAERKRTEGKPHKQITCAIARKLIVVANAVLKRGTPWISNPA